MDENPYESPLEDGQLKSIGSISKKRQIKTNNQDGPRFTWFLPVFGGILGAIASPVISIWIVQLVQEAKLNAGEIKPTDIDPGGTVVGAICCCVVVLPLGTIVGAFAGLILRLIVESRERD